MGFAQEVLKTYPEYKVWLLEGDLASGKTTFVKGLAEAQGLEGTSIKSPTFAFMTEHEPFIHYDLYRLENEDPFLESQLEEDLSQGKRVIIEWPERLPMAFGSPHLKIKFSHLGEGERSILVTEG